MSALLIALALLAAESVAPFAADASPQIVEPSAEALPDPAVPERGTGAPDPLLQGKGVRPCSRRRTTVRREASAFAVARVRTHEPAVALTFDACATKEQANGFDRPVYDILKAERIPATIFLSGRWIETHPDEARELASQEWLEIANHSYSHPRMPRLRARQAAEQLVRTNQLIEGLGRQSVLFRPPAGAWTAATARLAARQHLTIIQWDVVSGDAGGHVKPERMIKNVLAKTKPGSIIIFHINERGPYTQDALPAIIAGLRARGLRFVTVSQLMGLDDARLVAAKPDPLGSRKRLRPVADRRPRAGELHSEDP